jgi:hypothetical protein
MIQYPQHVMDEYGPTSPHNVASFYGYPVNQMTPIELATMVNWLQAQLQQAQDELSRERKARFAEQMENNRRNHYRSFWSRLFGGAHG